MNPMTNDTKIEALVDQLYQKLVPEGQSLSCHLEGLLHARYLTYWDYTRLNILLNLQEPRTGYPDETVFIVYHQITELYFKLILHELDQLRACRALSAAVVSKHVERVNRYFDNLVHSFDIMTMGMDQEQFLVFRTSLAPASGFQSLQYRLIEIYATSIANLLPAGAVSPVEDPAAAYQHIYWKQGAKDKESQRKDLSLVNFERAYDEVLAAKCRESAGLNVRALFLSLPEEERCACTATLRRFDRLMNVDWRLVHFRSAARHLVNHNETLRATGGTNWREYLPPRFQRIIFFPECWSDLEIEDWGKTFVEEYLA
jgi:tryptophan 2,3-dioxygenase